MSGPAVRILLADLAEETASAVKALTEMEQRWQIVGHTSGSEHVATLVAERRPHVLLIEAAGAGENLLPLISDLQARSRVRIVVLASPEYDSARRALHTLCRGAADLLPLPQSSAQWAAFPNRLGAVLLRVLEGEDSENCFTSGRRFDAAPAAPACLVLGGSTRSFGELAGLLAALEPPQPPVLVALPLPEGFTEPAIEVLDSCSRLTVERAEPHVVPGPNHVYLASGESHLMLRRWGSFGKLFLRSGEPVHGRKPATDVLFRSAADLLGPRLLAVLLPGTSADGLAGCRAIVAAGGTVMNASDARKLLAMRHSSEAAPVVHSARFAHSPASALNR